MFFDFPKNQRKIRQISAQETKSGQINKVIILWLYGLFNVLKTLYGAFILWFYHFLDSGQKFVKFFGFFLENLKISKRHSEIIWPLAFQNWDSQQGRDLATSECNRQKFQLGQSYS